MNDFVKYESLIEGDDFLVPAPAFEVTRERVDKYIQATGDSIPQRQVADENVHEAAPPMLAAVYVIEALRTRVGPPGGIHAKQRFKFHRPARIGETLYTSAKVSSLYLKNDHQYAEMTTETKNQDGELVTSGMITRIWGKGN